MHFQWNPLIAALALFPPFLGVAETTDSMTFLEKDGIVAMEVESTGSPLGEWALKTDVPEFRGTGHLEFTGNKPEMGPPVSPLKYRFRIEKAGNYQLTLRARKRLISEREDICNDCFVALQGDFDSATTAPMSVLTTDTKMFGGKPEGWGWAYRLDVKHEKHLAIYALKAGEVYELTISGRSQNFNLDRILFVHEDHDLETIQRENPPESDAS